MLRCLTTFILALAFTITSSHATTANGLALAYNEYMYTLEVEGAFQNPEELRAAQRRLYERVQTLRAAGMSDHELLQSALDLVQDNRLRSELESFFSTTTFEMLTDDSKMERLNSILTHSQTRGASWSHGGYILLGIAGFFALLFLPVIIWTVMGRSECYTEDWDQEDEEMNDHCAVLG